MTEFNVGDPVVVNQSKTLIADWSGARGVISEIRGNNFPYLVTFYERFHNQPDCYFNANELELDTTV